MHQPLHPEGFSTPANCAACRHSIRQGSQSFYLASLLLPVAIREPAYAVYAFCRTADDLIDRDEGGSQAIGELTRMLDRIYAGRPNESFVERGFADGVSRFALPRALPDALIEGLSWDASGRRYASLDELTSYAVRVAGTVGLMMTLVMGRREPDVLARACDLGVAMQLTNICRDVGEDAANGRIYLPLDWLDQSSIDVERWLAAPVYSAEIRSFVARLLEEAEGLYARSRSGIAELPSGCRLGIEAARLLYREIGQEVLRGVDPVVTRAVTTRNQKLRILSEVLTAGTPARADLLEPCVPQAAYLIEAVAGVSAPAERKPIPAWWNLKARSVHMIDLLNGFAARDAGGRVHGPTRIFASSDVYPGRDP